MKYVRKLLKLWRNNMINSHTKLCCIIGNPVEHSLSPIMHNAAYKALNLNFVYLAFKISDVKKALAGLKEIGVKGISVTIPFKQDTMKYLDEIDDTARGIGAVNTIVNKSGRFFGTNTDWVGATKALEETTILKGKKVAVLGAGGASRAVIYGLKQKGAIIHIFNRTQETAEKLKDEFRIAGAHLLNNLNLISEMDIIINTTSVGMAPNIDVSPVPMECIKSNQVVFDIIFAPKDTKLLQYAKEQKAQVVYGYKMLLYQAVPQFELFTGQKAPFNLMEKILLKNLD